MASAKEEHRYTRNEDKPKWYYLWQTTMVINHWLTILGSDCNLYDPHES